MSLNVRNALHPEVVVGGRRERRQRGRRVEAGPLRPVDVPVGVIILRERESSIYENLKCASGIEAEGRRRFSD